jgi:membrane-bound ClpP family serine protease
MAIGPNTALALSFTGILGIYLECLRPGRVIAGCIGVALLLWGVYVLFTYRPTIRGSLFLLFAGVLFAVEIFFRTRFVSSMAGTAALFAGLRELLPPPHPIQPLFALCVSVVFGFVTALLCAAAGEARRNKRRDIAPG